MNPNVLTKGDAFDSDASAFRAVAKGKDKGTEQVLIFEKGPLAGLVRFEFKAMGKKSLFHFDGFVLIGIDAWFEEDQQIYDHPKNPYTRIDILPSSRKITVKIGGVTIAESLNPMFLFETGLRTSSTCPKLR